MKNFFLKFDKCNRIICLKCNPNSSLGKTFPQHLNQKHNIKITKSLVQEINSQATFISKDNSFMVAPLPGIEIINGFYCDVCKKAMQTEKRMKNHVKQLRHSSYSICKLQSINTSGAKHFIIINENEEIDENNEEEEKEKENEEGQQQQKLSKKEIEEMVLKELNSQRELVESSLLVENPTQSLLFVNLDWFCLDEHNNDLFATKQQARELLLTIKEEKQELMNECKDILFQSMSQVNNFDFGLRSALCKNSKRKCFSRLQNKASINSYTAYYINLINFVFNWSLTETFSRLTSKSTSSDILSLIQLLQEDETSLSSKKTLIFDLLLLLFMEKSYSKKKPTIIQLFLRFSTIRRDNTFESGEIISKHCSKLIYLMKLTLLESSSSSSSSSSSIQKPNSNQQQKDQDKDQDEDQQQDDNQQDQDQDGNQVQVQVQEQQDQEQQDKDENQQDQEQLEEEEENVEDAQYNSMENEEDERSKQLAG